MSNALLFVLLRRLAAQEAAHRDSGYTSQFRRRQRAAGLSGLGDWAGSGGEVSEKFIYCHILSYMSCDPIRRIVCVLLQITASIGYKSDVLCGECFFFNTELEIINFRFHTGVARPPASYSFAEDSSIECIFKRVYFPLPPPLPPVLMKFCAFMQVRARARELY